MSENKKGTGALLWILAIVLTFALVYYQRTTGPTWPISGEVTVGNSKVSFVLLRSHGGEGGAPVVIKVLDKEVTGDISYKRYKSYDEWTTKPMVRNGDNLTFELPHLPPAGKIEYKIVLHKGNDSVNLSDDPVVLRYKGSVPVGILVPHIFFMFFSMLFGIRALLEVLAGGDKTEYLAKVIVFSLLIGGLILGPIVQKYAFGAYWTGWPFGHDLTDNKTIVMWVFWLIAWLKLRKDPSNKVWPVVAIVVMLAVYLIPHSTMGSEIDYTKQENKTESVK
jgi:hypothetical protein